MALSLQRYTWSNSSTGLNHILKNRNEREKERSVIEIKVRDTLPENVIVEILSWLPVKALLQFKNVCKSWYAIISSPIFISKHLKNYYYNNNSHDDCLLVQYLVTHAELQLYELLVDDTPSVVASAVLYGMPMYASYVCGPCDGIYYLFDYDFQKRALWNPAINELKVLPSIIIKPDLPSDLVYAQSEAYGFGYDPATEDYKVVVIKDYWHKSHDDLSDVTHPLSVLVYSVRTDSWTYSGDIDQKYYVKLNTCYILVDGCVYWLASCALSGNSELIISFDMGTDAIQKIQVPNYDQPVSESLGVYNDSLAFLAVHDNEKRFEIWTWSEGLWTKKFTMGPFSNVQRPLGHWKKNTFILECDGSKLALCDPNIEEIKDLAFHKYTLCRGVFIYRESLLSIKDRNKREHNEEAETYTQQI